MVCDQMPLLQTPSDPHPELSQAMDTRLSWPRRLGFASLLLFAGIFFFHLGHTGWRSYRAFSRDPIVHWLGLSHQAFVLERVCYEVSGVLLMLLAPLVFFKSSGRPTMLRTSFASSTIPGKRTAIGLGFNVRRVQPGDVQPTTHFQIHTRTVRVVHPNAPNHSSDPSDPSDPPSLR